MKKFFLLVFFFTIIGPGLPASGWADDSSQLNAASVKAIKSDEAAKLLADHPDEYILVDIRTPGEFAEGHIAGAKISIFLAPILKEKWPGSPRINR